MEHDSQHPVPGEPEDPGSFRTPPPIDGPAEPIAAPEDHPEARGHETDPPDVDGSWLPLPPDAADTGDPAAPPPPPPPSSADDSWFPLPPAAPEPVAAPAVPVFPEPVVPQSPPPPGRLVYPIMTSPGAAGTARPADTRPVAHPQQPLRFDHPATAARPLRSGWRALGLALLGGLVGAAATAAVLFALGAFEETEPPPPGAPGVTIIERTQTEIINTETMEVAAAVGRKVIPSIVTVEVGVGTPESFTPLGSGSGVVFSDDGYVITNNHVVEDAQDLRVIIADGRIYSADVIGVDVPTDLAVIKVAGDGFTPIEVGSAEVLSIGDPAIAVGSPLGLEGGPSLTVGVISAFNRDVQTGPDVINDLLRGMIQTDAPITRGSSGGALVDAAGKLIGITTAVGVSDVGAEGIGFATPIEIVNRVVEEIIEIGRVRPSFIGIVGQTTYEERDDGAIFLAGALITDIVTDTGAAAAGLAPGDVIVGINGHEVRSMGDVIVAIRRYRVDDEVEFTIKRDGEEMTLMVVLGERPPDT